MDRIYFSAWLRGFTQHNMHVTFEKLLRLVPYSRLRPDAMLTIHAVSYNEPTLLEHRFDHQPKVVRIADVETDAVAAVVRADGEVAGEEAVHGLIAGRIEVPIRVPDHEVHRAALRIRHAVR